MEDKISKYNGFSVPAKNVSYPRVGHKVIQMEEYAYIFGGIGSDGSFVKNILKFNLEKLRIQPVPTQNYLGIEGFSLFSYMGLIFLWGGNIQDKVDPSSIKVSNTLWCFDGKKFVISDQLGQIPAPRSFHCSAWVANRFLLIYGGCSQSEFFSDWRILDMKTITWHSMKICTKISLNGIYQLGWVNGRGIMVKSETVIRNGQRINSVLKNQLFEVRITNFHDFTIRIDPLAYFQNELPPSRSDPTLIFTNKQIYMLGGGKDTQKLCSRAASNQFHKDFWVFDFETLEWAKKPVDLSVQYKFEAIKYRKKVFLFGGIKSSSMQLSSCIQVTLLNPEEHLIEQKICQFCRCIYGLENYDQKNRNPSNLHQKQPESSEEPIAQISTSFITKISELLDNPLQAITLLIDNSLNMSASIIQIKMIKKIPNTAVNFSQTDTLNKNNKIPPIYYKDDLTYLYIGDNSQLFHSDEFIRIFHILRWKVAAITPDVDYDEQIRMQNQYVLNLKLATLKLGKTCLFVTKTSNEQVLVIYFSDDSYHAPDGQRPLNCFYYKLTIKQEGSDNNETCCSNKTDRQIIKNNVGHAFDQKQFLDVSSHTTKLYVFQLKDIVETELNCTKNYVNKSWNSVVSSRTQPDSETKYDIGFMYANRQQSSSLHELVTKLYLTPYIGRQIFIQNSKVCFLDFSAKFRDDYQNQLIEKIDLPMSQMALFQKCCLYKITSLNYSSAVVLIYHENRLITVISTKQHNLCGFIEIPDEIQVDIFKSRIAKVQDQKKLLHYLSSKDYQPKKIKQHRQQLLENSMSINTNQQIGRKISNIQFYSMD